MFDVYLKYTDSNDILCQNIESIEVPAGTGSKKISGDELLNHNFSYYDSLRLYSATSNFSVRCKGLLYSQIIKK